MWLVKFGFFVLLTALFHSAVFASDTGKIVLVLDDIGNQIDSGKASIQIPWVTTVAIMPNRPYSEQLAYFANDLNKEIIVHAPMSNQINFPLGPLGLDHEMGKELFLETAQMVVHSVPFAVGLSNHMGSKLTQDPEAMDWLMSVLKKDHYHEADFMARQWQEGLKRAIDGETVIIICHPYPETIEFLSSLTLNEEEQAMLTPLSNVLHYPVIVNHNERNLPKGT
ncbi:MAG: divergent polysaccharide deacetylase family protein [Reinekea sp.]